MPRHRKLVAVDFDGTIHAYTTPWTNAETISDGPTPGAMEFLSTLAGDPRFEVVVVSSRCSNPLAVERIEAWLLKNLQEAFGERDGYDIFSSGLRVMQSDEGKLPAHILIDDRAFCFEGRWPSLDALADFKPHNKRPAGAAEVDKLIATTAAARAKADADLLDGLLRVLIGPHPEDPDFTWLSAMVTTIEGLEGAGQEAWDGEDPLSAHECLKECRRMADGLREVLRPRLERMAAEAEGRSA